MDKDTIQKTIHFWQPYSDVPLTEENAREINENIVSLFDYLAELDLEQQKLKGGDQNGNSSVEHQKSQLQ